MKATVKQCIILILCAALTAAGLPAFAAGNDPDPTALIPLSFSETIAYINEHAPGTDGDDALTPQDAGTVLRQAVKKDPVSREGEWDLDGDGILTPQDARLTLRTAFGLEKPLFMGLPPRFSGDTA